jgi:hypothetical protein
MSRTNAIAAAALLALCLAAPALANEQAPSVMAATITAVPAWQSPPPNDLLNEVVALRLSCARWKDSVTTGFESEAHVCAVLAGGDPAYREGVITGSWITAAGLAGVWLLFRLVLRVPMARRARTAP